MLQYAQRVCLSVFMCIKWDELKDYYKDNEEQNTPIFDKIQVIENKKCTNIDFLFILHPFDYDTIKPLYYCIEVTCKLNILILLNAV